MQDGLAALLDEYWIVEGPEQILLDFPTAALLSSIVATTSRELLPIGTIRPVLTATSVDSVSQFRCLRLQEPEDR
jgi:hypothetical protein